MAIGVEAGIRQAIGRQVRRKTRWRSGGERGFRVPYTADAARETGGVVSPGWPGASSVISGLKPSGVRVWLKRLRNAGKVVMIAEKPKDPNTKYTLPDSKA